MRSSVGETRKKLYDALVSHSLAPVFLLSMPQMTDANFDRTVVLLCEHSEDGAFGLVLNRPVMTSGRIAVNLDPPFETDRAIQVWVGGPVEPQRSWMLVGKPPDDDTEGGMVITDGLYLSTSPTLLRRTLEPDPPSRVRLMVGYAGWAAGQLEAELAASAWLLSEVDPEFVFSVDPCEMWEVALRRLGAEPGSLGGQVSRGVH
jgi:putative transcriptional regulator